MKRSDLETELRNLIRNRLLELNEDLNISSFANEMVAVAERYMLPKPTRKLLDTPDGDIPVTVNEWE